MFKIILLDYIYRFKVEFRFSFTHYTVKEGYQISLEKINKFYILYLPEHTVNQSEILFHI